MDVPFLAGVLPQIEAEEANERVVPVHVILSDRWVLSRAQSTNAPFHLSAEFCSNVFFSARFFSGPTCNFLRLTPKKCSP